MVLLTDGNQTGIDRVPDQTPLVDAIQPIKDLGVKVIAIGIGSVDRDQLLTLVDSPEDILTPQSFDELLGLIRTTVEKSCRGMYVTELSDCYPANNAVNHLVLSCELKPLRLNSADVSKMQE